MEATEGSRGQHVAVLAFPFGTHAVPVLKLVLKLARTLPEVQFSFLNTEKSNASLFSTPKNSLPGNIKPYNVEDGVPLDYVLTGNPLEKMELFIQAMPENFKRTMDVAVAETGKKINILITDAFLTCAADMAKDLLVPWISIWTATPYNLSAHVYTHQIRKFCSDIGSGNGGFAGIRDTKLEFIAGLSGMCIGDLPDEIFQPADSEESLFSCMLSKVGSVLPQAAAVGMSYYQELCPASLAKDLKSRAPIMLNLGFLTLSLPPPPSPPSSDSDATGCLSFLDRQKPMSVAYISFGTVATPPLSELAGLAEALESCGISYLWSLKENSKGDLPDGFVERTRMQGKIVPWAPQTLVLAHSSVVVFITHSGCNSMYESLANGVPMICRPFFGDHKMNSWMVEEIWRVGVRVEGGVLTNSGVLKSLELILADEQGKKMRENAQALKELVLKANGPDGSVTQDFRTLVELIPAAS